MKRRIFITVFLAVFIALLGVGIVIPVMPLYAENLGATGFTLGLIVAAFSVTRGVLQPFVGNWSDKWGRKGFLMAGLLVFALVGLLVPQAQSVLHLIIIRAFHGVGSAMIVPIGMAYMSYLAPKGHEGRYMSYLNIAIFCGIGCGPIFGGLFSDTWGLVSAFYFMAGLSALAFILVIFSMPQGIQCDSEQRVGLLRSIRKMAGSRKTVGLLVSRFSTMIMMVPTMAFLPLLMESRLGGTGLQIGFIIACRTLVNAVLQVPFGRLADKYNKVLLLIAGAGCMGVVIMLIPGGDTFSRMVLLYILLGLGEAVIWPVLGAYATQEGREHYGHGTMMGVFNFAMSGGVFAGALLAGVSMDIWGMEWAFYVCGTVVFIVTAFGAYLIADGERSPSAEKALPIDP